MFSFIQNNNRLVCSYDGEELWLEPWGLDGIRVRGTKLHEMPQENWALDEEKAIAGEIEVKNDQAFVKNGRIKAIINKYGRITYYNQNGKKLLEEYWRHRVDNAPDNPDQGHGGTDIVQGVGCALQKAGREYHPILKGDYELNVRFESQIDEKLYGMGQYQQPFLDLKNTTLELAQRNSQASVPFLVSSLGYGFLWNSPSVGNVELCKNLTVWHSESEKKIDYWITAGDTPAQIEENYAEVVGKVPMIPDWAMGFWQCKLRYQTQEELLEVAREYKKRGIPLSVIVIDFFHWPTQGDWKFDPIYWPDPDAMIEELKKMGIELMVSVWPTVDYRSENYKEMKAKGYLLHCDRGFPVSINYMGNTLHYDATNENARKYVWEKIKKNYYDKGIRLFWLDEAEPEFTNYDFDIYRTHIGPHMQVGNIYPVAYARTFYEGMRQEGQENIINLVRCAWAGSQKYGALVWSGDIYSSFESMRCQITAGLNMAMAGIPWWTTDIGGFFGGHVEDQNFRELLIRWFAYGTFCPVMRLHGCRLPQSLKSGNSGGADCLSGAPNEIWSYGDMVYDICRKYIDIREKMKPYIKKQMTAAHVKGTPVMRPIFYDFPEDKKAWDIEDAYMFGPDMLVAPVAYSNTEERLVYLPEGANWTDAWTKEIKAGGQYIRVETPLEQIPVFFKDDFSLQFE